MYKQINQQGDTIMVCEECYCVIDDNASGDPLFHLCKECFNEKYFMCDECGAIFKNEEGHKDAQLCNECYDYLKNKGGMKKYLFRLCKRQSGPNKLYVYDLPEGVDVTEASITREPMEVYDVSEDRDYMFSRPGGYAKIAPLPYYFRNTQIIYAQLSCQILEFTADIELPKEVRNDTN